MQKIDFTRAIVAGKLTFEQACDLKGKTMTEAIAAGVLTFEQACELQGIAAEAAVETVKEKAPKKQKQETRKQKKAREKREKKAAEAAPVTVKKAEEAYHTPKKHSLTDYQVKRLDNAVLKLWEAGYESAEWRVEGQWAWIYPFSGEKGTGYSPAFREAVEKAFKSTKWEYSAKRGAVVYRDFIK